MIGGISRGAQITGNDGRSCSTFDSRILPDALVEYIEFLSTKSSAQIPWRCQANENGAYLECLPEPWFPRRTEVHVFPIAICELVIFPFKTGVERDKFTQVPEEAVKLSGRII